MKKISAFLFVMCLTLGIVAQNSKLSYQAVVRNSANELVTNTNVTIDISIANSLSGNAVYSERHDLSTNQNGLVSLLIGTGSNPTGNMANVSWATAFITSDYTLPGGAHVINTVPVSAVPYALYADTVNEQSLANYLTTHNYAKTSDVTAQVNADWNATEGAAQILNKPNLFSGDYKDLTNTPTLFDGDYNSLSNKPEIPTVPENVSAFNNDANYITVADVPAQVNADWNATEGAAQILNKPELFSGDYNDLTNTPTLFDGDYNSLSNKPEIPTVPENVSAFNNDANYITVADVPAQVNADWNATEGAAQILNKPELFSGDYNDLTNTPTLFDGDYNSLSNKPEIPTVPENVSAFNNDAHYITVVDVPTKVSAFTNDAGYITAAEAPAQVNADWNATEGAAQILNKPELFSGDYNDLTNTPTLFDGNYNSLSNKPEIPTVPENVSAFNNDAHYITVVDVPTKVSAFTNDAGYITAAEAPAQVNADWNATEGAAQILNKPELFSGDYNDLTNKPNIGSGFYFVTYNANTGTGSMNAQIFPLNMPQTIMYNTFTKTGYDFVGWNEKADNSGTNHTEGEVMTLTENKELYAQWTIQHYTISYNGNGAEGNMENQEFVYGTPQSLRNNTFTKEGHVFNGWNTQANGSGIAYANQYNLSATSDLTLYAQWIPETYTLTFMANNGTDEKATQIFTYGQAQNLMSNPFSYSGYNFADWNTSADGSGNGYTDHKNMTLTEDMTLYARWTLIPTFVVIFDANGGQGTMDPQTFMQGVAQALVSNTFTREGFDFMGWNTNASGLGTYYRDGQTIMLSASTTLYAKWQKNSGYVDPDAICTVSNIRSNESGTGNTLTAVRDHQNNTYAVVQIGTQCWLKENMRATTSPSTGTDILQFPAVNSSYTGKRAYYPKDDVETAARVGVLYNWNAAVDTFNITFGETSYGTNSYNAVGVTFKENRRGICPEGWHIPSEEEYKTLRTVTGTEKRGAGKLAAGDDWMPYTPITDDDDDVPGYKDYAQRNITGFSAVPAGSYGGNYYDFGKKNIFWIASQTQPKYAICVNLEYNRSYVDVNNSSSNTMNSGFSVRCLRD